jgi:hypothetical protein
MRSMRSMLWRGFLRSNDPGLAISGGDRNQITLLAAQRPCPAPLLDAGNTETGRPGALAATPILPRARFRPRTGAQPVGRPESPDHLREGVTVTILMMVVGQPTRTGAVSPRKLLRAEGPDSVRSVQFMRSMRWQGFLLFT